MAEFFKGAHWKVCPIICGVMTTLIWHSVGCLSFCQWWKPDNIFMGIINLPCSHLNSNSASYKQK